MPFSTIIIFDAQNNVKPENHFLLNFQRRLICKSFADVGFSVSHFPQPVAQPESDKPRNLSQTRRPAKSDAAKIIRKTRIVCQSSIIKFESLKAQKLADLKSQKRRCVSQRGHITDHK